MPADSELPIKKTHSPADQAELVAAVRQAAAAKSPLYPIGGGTSLDYGLPAKREGAGLSLARLDRVVDFPARDMTITVEAGITLDSLAKTLAAERQQFPIDVPRPEKATVGGVVATNWNGPRRFGLGAVRDFVIGISAVDGTGRPFKGGGRVVKNVAGYDFCKLLTGSLGTLGVITQLTLRTKPLPEESLLLACEVTSLDLAERLLAALVGSGVTPSAIELLCGPAWEQDSALVPLFKANTNKLFLLVGLEGTHVEVQWMQKQLAQEWTDLDIRTSHAIVGAPAKDLWRRLAEFPDPVGNALRGVPGGADAPLVLKANLAASGVAPFIAALREIDPRSSMQAHAGSGVVIARFSEFPAGGLSRILIGKLQPLAANFHGHVQVLANPGRQEVTHQSVFGGLDAPFELMTAIKQQFDPHDILNPGRFVYV